EVHTESPIVRRTSPVEDDLMPKPPLRPNYSETPSLQLLRELASEVPEAERARYAEIYEILANPSPKLFGEAEIAAYDEQIHQARIDLHNMLSHWSVGRPDNQIIRELETRYQPKASID